MVCTWKDVQHFQVMPLKDRHSAAPHPQSLLPTGGVAETRAANLDRVTEAMWYHSGDIPLMTFQLLKISPDCYLRDKLFVISA